MSLSTLDSNQSLEGSTTVHRRRRVVIRAAALVIVGALVAAGIVLVQREYFGPRGAEALSTPDSSPATWWWSPGDAALETTIGDPALGSPATRAVPMRKGQVQGVVMLVSNNSGYDQTVIGAVGSNLLTVQTSTDGDAAAGLAYRDATYADDVTIPAGGQRFLRILTTPFLTCMPYDTGSALVVSDVLIMVRTGWVTRTESVAAAEPMALLSKVGDTPASCHR